LLPFIKYKAASKHIWVENIKKCVKRENTAELLRDDKQKRNLCLMKMIRVIVLLSSKRKEKKQLRKSSSWKHQKQTQFILLKTKLSKSQSKQKPKNANQKEDLLIKEKILKTL
jgi:hypothetical protein